MATPRKGPEQSAPVHRQLWRMKRLCPQFHPTWRCGEVVWQGNIQPTANSCDYKIRITYRPGFPPDVEVLDPALVNRSATERIPHLYEGKRLCLFLPHAFEWDATMMVAETTVPWATLWLHHYEVWMATGEWLGGGAHPPRGHRR